MYLARPSQEYRLLELGEMLAGDENAIARTEYLGRVQKLEQDFHIGRITKGAHAQEECLCRISTLYPCLNVSKNWDRFYKPHRQLDLLYNSDMIYTPGTAPA